jgi:hypothetical protein
MTKQKLSVYDSLKRDLTLLTAVLNNYTQELTSLDKETEEVILTAEYIEVLYPEIIEEAEIVEEPPDLEVKTRDHPVRY